MRSARRFPARFAAAAAAALFAASPAVAQPPASPPGVPPDGAVRWTLVSGYSTASIRDIARTGPPVEASPMALTGDGPAILVRHDRATKVRLHRFEVEFARTGTLSFDSPVGPVARREDGRFTRFGGRYEYRRYLFRDLAIRGLDIGLGIQGAGERVALTRDVPAGITIAQDTLQAGAGVVAAARLHRWHRFDLEALWVNSISIGRTSLEHSADGVSVSSSPGGGWVTDLRLTTSVRVASLVSLVAAYGRGDGGVVSSHLGVTSSERQAMVGVMYGR